MCQEYYHTYGTSAQQFTAGDDVEITDGTTGAHSKVKIKIKTMLDGLITDVFDAAGDKRAETNEDDIGDDFDVEQYFDALNSDSAAKIR